MHESTMKILPLCFILSLALTLGICKDSTISGKTITSGVYITTTLDNFDTFTAIQKLKSYSSELNTDGQNLIVQGEKRCPPIGELKWKYSYSLLLKNVQLNKLSVPSDDSIKLDFQLGSTRTVHEKSFDIPVPVSQVYDKLIEFSNEIHIPIQQNWFYVSGFQNLSTTPTFSKLWLEGAPRYKRHSCAPDDSNVQRLCSKTSSYKCPNTTYCMDGGIETRNMAMNIVTGGAKDKANQSCSYNAAIMNQYMNNHRYFRGANKANMTMKRTVPVMTKITTRNAYQSSCPKNYQLQFYVPVNPAPCPTNRNVLLEKITNMEAYVKVFNGHAHSDMDFLYQYFSQELTSNHRPYVAGQYYLSVFRGSGPLFARRLEIWILKKPLSVVRQSCC